jgi:hypothetical protein
MPEEWISQNEYMRRYGLGFATVKELVDTKQVESIHVGSHIRIKVGGNTVSKEIYEEEKKKRIEAETIILTLKKILEGVK